MDFGLMGGIAAFFAMLVGEIFGCLFGGGSFFVQPALVLVGIPAKTAIANDIAAAAFSSLGFILTAKNRPPLVKQATCYGAITMIAGAFIGGHVLSVLPERVSELMILGICTIGFLYVAFHLKTPAAMQEVGPIRYWKFVLAVVCLFLGFYDGLSGAGGGIVLIAAIALIMRQSMASTLLLANTLSFISLMTAGLTFLWLGMLDFKLLAFLIPAAFLGGSLAAKISERVPDKVLRGIYIIVLSALLVYFGLTILQA